jgi:hypothetical protein
MNLYQQVFKLVAPYFDSPDSATRFLARQCREHLGRETTDLGPHDLWNLSKWVAISGRLLVGQQKADEMSDKIRELRKSMGEVPLRDRTSGGELHL